MGNWKWALCRVSMTISYLIGSQPERKDRRFRFEIANIRFDGSYRRWEVLSFSGYANWKIVRPASIYNILASNATMWWSVKKTLHEQHFVMKRKTVPTIGKERQGPLHQNHHWETAQLMRRRVWRGPPSLEFEALAFQESSQIFRFCRFSNNFRFPLH